MTYNFKKQLKSFGYAWRGLCQCVGHEQNLGTHLVVAVVVVIAGALLGLNPIEWVAVCLCIGLVVAAELVNTALERLVDLVSPQHHPLAGQVKDIAAGAVLVCAMAAAVAGLIIFVPKIIALCGT